MTRWTIRSALAATALGMCACDDPAPTELTVVQAQAKDEPVDVPAEEDVQAAPPRVPPDDDVRTDRAWSLIAVRRYAEAESLLGEVLADYPDAAKAEFFLGVSYQKQKDYERARRQFERVIASGVAFERDEVLYYFYGWGLYWLGDLDTSRQAFETFIESMPGEADAWFALGLIDYDEDKLDDAEKNFNHALSLHAQMAREDPQRYRQRLQSVAKCHGRLADVHIRREHLEAARDSLQQAIELWPRNHQPYYKLYRVLARLGDEEGAARALATHQRRLREQGISGGDG